MKLSLYIPSSQYAIGMIAASHIAKVCGGCTVQQVTGLWKNRQGQVDQEEITLVYVIQDAMTQELADVILDISSLLHDAGEEEVMLEMDDDVRATFFRKPNELVEDSIIANL